MSRNMIKIWYQSYVDEPNAGACKFVLEAKQQR